MFLLGAALMFAVQAFDKKSMQEKYILQRDSEIARAQSGPHNGGGQTIAYPFFEGIQNLDLAFRKRTLQPGSSIGYHFQETDEIYYILEGKGIMQMNGDSFRVAPGDAILTRPGSSHGLKPADSNHLTLMIAYQLKGK